jgi:hypothetical protein
MRQSQCPVVQCSGECSVCLKIGRMPIRAVVEVARSIRPYLPALVGSAAGKVDRQLTELLTAALDCDADDEVDGRILGVLASTPATHAWAAAVLADEQHLPPEVREIRERSEDGGYAPLPNPRGGDPVDAQKYVCPVDGAFAWWRISVGQPVPTCPDHPDELLRPA